MRAPALELAGVSRSWLPGTPIFSKLNMQVPDKGITVLLGPSGCGKSTLLRCAASMDTPEEGTILVNGNPVEEPSPDRQMILQGDNQLLPWLTVGENILFPGKHSGKVLPGKSDSAAKTRDRKPAEISPDKLLEDVGLPGHSASYPARLSGGMRQRAVLARALAAQPSILLLDEPFAALDTVIRAKLQELLRSLQNKRPVAMLMVTHDVSEALILADHLVFMDSGGEVSEPEDNPLGGERDPGSFEFFEASKAMRRRYDDLMEPGPG